MSNNYIEIESLTGLTNKPFIVKMLHNDFRLWHSGTEIFQLSRLADGITTALVSHGDIVNGVLYLQGQTKIDNVLGSLQVDEQVIAKGLTGKTGEHFIVDLKTNDFKIKMNDGVEALQVSKLADNVTTALVSHGDTNSGVIDIHGKLKVKGVELGGAFESSTATNDNVTTEMDTGITNQAQTLVMFLHVQTASQDSYMEVQLIKQGSTYTASIGRQSGKEFTQLAVAYNATKSGSLGTHYIDVVGTGSGASMTFNVRTDINFKR